MKKVGSMTNVRQMEAEKYARDIGLHLISQKHSKRRSRAIARAKGR